MVRLRVDPAPLADLLLQDLCLTSELTDTFATKILSSYGRGVRGLFFYGSCLWDKTRKSTSFHDFFLICDSYRSLYTSPRHALLNASLPPNVYFHRFSHPKLGEMRCKVCITSLERFASETSPIAKDLYHSGRFGKRVALVYSAGRRWSEKLARCLARARMMLTPLVLTRIGRQFTLQQFIHAVMAISYAAESRPETGVKVHQLMEVENDHYEKTYGALLDLLSSKRLWIEKLSAGRYRQLMPPLEEAFWRARCATLLRASRFRAQARWFKNMMTVDNWLEVILEKVERSAGIKIELTPIERRFPLLLGWSHYFALKRGGHIR